MRGEPRMLRNHVARRSNRNGRYMSKCAEVVIGLFRKIGILVFVAALLISCSSSEPVQTKTVAEAPKAAEPYVIGPTDELDIIVWKEPQVSGKVEVAGDGTITVPLAGQVRAAGLTTRELQDNLTKDLKPFLASPNVTVRVADAKSQVVYVLGAVQKPGMFPLRPGEDLSQALAQAGGFTEFADPSAIHLARHTPTETQQLTINYEQVRKGRDLTADVKLVAGDTITVP